MGRAEKASKRVQGHWKEPGEVDAGRLMHRGCLWLMQECDMSICTGWTG